MQKENDISRPDPIHLKKYFVVLTAMLLLTIMACSSGGGHSSGNNGGSDEDKRIGAAGGTIEDTNSASKMFHTRIVIPAGALDADTVISFRKIENAASLPDDMAGGGVVIDFGPDRTVFKSNIGITIPYHDKNNDGIVDDTDIPENQLLVLYWDSQSQAWTIVDKFKSRDTINNTITFETNHFGQYTTSGHKSIKVSIFAAEGLNLVLTARGVLFSDDTIYPARFEYLCSGLLQAKALNITEEDCYTFRGLDPDRPWAGDATETFDYSKELAVLLTEKAQAAKDQGKKFIVISHSWGPELAKIGLSLSGVEPDLFITLSDPEGARYVNAASYNDGLSGVIPPLVVSTAESIILNIVQRYVVDVMPSMPIKTKRWINYWDFGDMSSGPLQPAYNSNSIDDRTVINFTERNFQTTRKVHSMTALNNIYWREENAVTEEEGKAFRDRVIYDILGAM